uniref:Uncharacterized protein n=1 Tax=Magallana gigas TaxID=29159 RepID=K1Q4P3_MAGGI
MVKSPWDPGLYSVDDTTRKFQAWASHLSSHSCRDLFGMNMIFVQSRIRVLSLLEALEFLSVGFTRDQYTAGQQETPKQLFSDKKSSVGTLMDAVASLYLHYT